MNKNHLFVLMVSLFLIPGTVFGQKALKDLEYATPNGHSVKLDLYLPEEGDGPFPVVVWIHGGGWKNGDKADCPPAKLGYCAKGYAAVSLSYRLSGVAPFPAQVEDVKAAIRWLRANAKEYKLDKDRIGVWGVSAGGHLVCMLGLTGKTKEFDVGDHLDQSSEVQAVCNWCGPAHLEHAYEGLDMNTDLTKQLVQMYKEFLGGSMDEKKELVKKASPYFYVHQDAPPFLHVHGTMDTLVPVEQSEMLHDHLRQHNVESRLILLPQVWHTGPEFGAPKLFTEIQIFFDKHLKK